jgi:hypothetical protein
MFEKLEAKIEKIAEGYADLVDMSIQSIKNNELCGVNAMTELNEEIGMLHHSVAALERIVRLNRGDETNGQL